MTSAMFSVLEATDLGLKAAGLLLELLLVDPVGDPGGCCSKASKTPILAFLPFFFRPGFDLTVVLLSTSNIVFVDAVVEVVKSGTLTTISLTEAFVVTFGVSISAAGGLLEEANDEG
jgi:hypothetical protein